SLALASAVKQCMDSSCYSIIWDTSAQAAAETTTVFPSSSQGFAIVYGTVNIPPFLQGTTGGPPPAGVNVTSQIVISSNGVIFNAIADPNGNYNLFVPLQADPFRYADANLQIVDPITQNPLNTTGPGGGAASSAQHLDLSTLTTDSKFQAPTFDAFLDC